MKRLALVFPFALMLLLLWHSWFGPDIWYHLTWGRSLIESFSFWPETRTLLEQPVFANGYWLFQVIVTAVMDAGGVEAVSALFLLLWCAVAILWLRETRAGSAGAWGVTGFLAFVLLAQLRFEARPEIFSYLFLMAEIVTLTRLEGRPKWIALFAVQALWVNCHGYFALGPLLGCAWAVADLLERRFSRRSFLPGLILLAGCLVSPFPLGVWQAVFAYVEVGRALSGINQELQPPVLFPLTWPMTLFWLVWAVVAVTTVWNLVRRRHTFAAIIGLAGVILAFQASRNIPLFLLMAAPIVEVLFAPAARRHLSALWPSVPAGLAALIAVSVVTGGFHRRISSLGSFGVKLEPSAYPVHATEFLRASGFKGKLFCDSYDGGYLEYHLPEVRVAGDSYFASPEATLKYFAAIRDPRALRAFDETFHFDGLVINVENLEVIESLWSDSRWHLAFVDSHRAVYLLGATPVEYASGQFYRGEDLTHWANAFGVATWSGLALKHRDVKLMGKILRDLEASARIPGEVLKYAAILAAEAHDRALFFTVMNLRAKALPTANVSLDDLAQTLARAQGAL